MKKLFLFALIVGITNSFSAFAQQDKSKRVSPPATVSETLSNGVKVTVDYSQPSVKGRVIGTELAPYGKVWRTGANEATIFEVSKAVKVEGKALAAGKYSLYTIPGEKEWIIIFNKAWNQWGTVYNVSEDALRVNIKATKSASFTEKLTFNISKAGEISIIWGDNQANFNVK